MKDHTASMIKSDVAFLKEKLMPTLEMWEDSFLDVSRKQDEFFLKKAQLGSLKNNFAIYIAIPKIPNITHAKDLIKFVESGNGEVYLSKDDYDYCVNFSSKMTPIYYIEEINKEICFMNYMIEQEKEKQKKQEDKKEPKQKISDLNIEYGKGEATWLIIGLIAICAAAIVAYFAH